MKNTMRTKAIYFDMDGTIADFYGVAGWLACLENSDPRPYAEASPLVDMAEFSEQLRRLRQAGYHIGIVSWLSRSGSAEFNAEVTQTKLRWLAHYVDFVFDEIRIVPYGTPKSSVCDFGGVLFDDEERNRIEWGKADIFSMAFGVSNILAVLRGMR